MAPHKEAALNWGTILGNLLGGGQEGDDTGIMYRHLGDAGE